MKNYRKIFASKIFMIVFLSICFILSGGCGKTNDAHGSSEMVSTLCFNEKTLSVAVGDTVQSNLVGLEADEGIAAYSSNNSSVAQIDADGLISGISVGSAVVKAVTDKGNAALLMVEVFDKSLVNIPVIVLSKSDITIQKGDEFEIDAQLKLGTKEIECEMIWRSDDERVASVGNGKISANGEGAAIITAETVYDGVKVTAEANVTVLPIGFAICPDYENRTVYKGNSFPLSISATDEGEKISLEGIVYTSGNPDIAFLSEENGVTMLRAVAGGDVKITAEFRYDGIDYSFSTVLHIYGTHTVSVYALGYTNTSRDTLLTGKMYGDVITLELTKPVVGRAVKCWYVDGVRIEGNSFIMPDANVVAYAKYINETEGDFTASFTAGTMFGISQITPVFVTGDKKDVNGLTSTDNNYVSLTSADKSGASTTFNFDETVVVSDLSSAVIRMYCESSTSVYFGIGDTKKSLYSKTATSSTEPLKKTNIDTDCWVEIVIPLNDFVSNGELLGNISVGISNGGCLIDYIMLKY